VVAVLLWLAYQVRAVLTPVLFGLAMAYVFNPIVSWTHQRWRWPRWAATLLIMLTGAVLVVSVALYTLPPLYAQSHSLTRDLKRFVEWSWGKHVQPRVREAAGVTTNPAPGVPD